MTAPDTNGAVFKVVIVGAGVAGLETALALHHLAGDRVAVTLVTPNHHFRYRPLVIREPFSSQPMRRYRLEEIARRADATLLYDKFDWLDPAARELHTTQGRILSYDAVVLALGARQHPRFKHALTLETARLGEQLADFVAGIDQGTINSAAFIIPSLPVWPVPAYELALMTAHHAKTIGREMQVLLITPEDEPLGALGVSAGAEVGMLLEEAGITLVTGATALIREPGRIEIHPMRGFLAVDRIIALPELYAPPVRGVPTSAERGFVSVDGLGAVPGLERVYAAGDITDAPVKHGALAGEMADVVAHAIAALAGVDVELRPLRPALFAMLLGAPDPLFIRSQSSGELGIDLEISTEPLWDPPEKLHTEYLGACLAEIDAERRVAQD